MGYLKPQKTKTMSDFQKIQHEVESYFNQVPGVCQLKTRKREIVNSRQISQYFAKELTKESLDCIAKYFGGQGHCMVIHSCKTVNNLIDVDRKYKADIERLKIRMNGLYAKAKFKCYLPREQHLYKALREISGYQNIVHVRIALNALRANI